MQNMKYLGKVIDEEDRFGIILNEHAQKHTEHIQMRMALSLLEFFNSGKFVDEKDIKKIDNVFYVSKEKYLQQTQPQKSKVFSVRINLDDSDGEIEKKITKLTRKIEKYRNYNK